MNLMKLCVKLVVEMSEIKKPYLVEGRRDSRRVCLRYVYIIEYKHDNMNRIINLPTKGEFYTGITTDLGRRFKQHEEGVWSAHMNKWKRGARDKKLVYVEYLWGNEFDAKKREYMVKKLLRVQKYSLIIGEKNQLVNHIKKKRKIVLKRYNYPKEQIVIDYVSEVSKGIKELGEKYIL